MMPTETTRLPTALAIRLLARRVRAGTDATGRGLEPAPLPPARIGPFTLGDELGRGGFGVVYRAEQDPPLARWHANPTLQSFFRQ